MKTIVYFVRHSKPLKEKEWYLSNDSLQLQNEKDVLSVEGETMACKHFDNSEFDNIDAVYSSNYVRTIATAKYVTNINGLKIKIIDNFGERKIGINSWDEYPNNFEDKQFIDENYKLGTGESQKEVFTRMENIFSCILKENQGKKIVIVTHATAMIFLFKKWCDIQYGGNYMFGNNVFFNGKWNYLETFKLEFDNEQLLNVYNIKT